ncbi:uncharacterized protein A4U43_C03F640 [Asparagus officinalis]|uniref:Uncharacterized protein n=1 Tax=Asparagus officinalis TaxID=4686 RepID=A0A5P1FB78_ASPOF|nr:uncharacterized protein A4U43_C03F640 [Asparagus officinalis]
MMASNSSEIHDISTAEICTPKKLNLIILPSPLAHLLPPFLLKKVMAEVIATFMLVFVTCGAGALSRSDQHRVSQLGASVAGGLIVTVVTVMIYAVGHISGAHMNPAVTLAFAVTRHFPWVQVPFYMSAQFTGAMIASFTLHKVLPPLHDLGTTTPSGTAYQALVMEIIATFTLMFVTSAVATDTRAVGELAGLAVGSSVCIGAILAGPISGGSMNPARTLGPAVVSSNYREIWVYMVGPVVGALMGAWSYNFIRATDKAPPLSAERQSSFKLQRLQSMRQLQEDHASARNRGSDPMETL